MKKHALLVIGALVTAFSTSASATAFTCTTDSFAITKAGVTGTPLMSIGAISASSCLTGFNTQKGINSYNVSGANLGYAGDGLLNGAGSIVSPTQFIDASDLQELNPATPGQRIDPGWIQLGTMKANSGNLNTFDIIPPDGARFDLSEVLSYTQTQLPGDQGMTGGKGGNWTLTIFADAVQTLNEKGVFLNNNFDHLAFQVKAGNNWAVYDFDFTELSGFDLSKPYTISGTWNLNDFRNSTNNSDQDISMLSVWARDPLAAADVPEPGTMALFGAGLMALAGLSRRRQRK